MKTCIYCLLFVAVWLQPLALFAQKEEKLFAGIEKSYRQAGEVRDIVDFEGALNRAHEQVVKLQESFPGVNEDAVRIREIKEVFMHTEKFMRRASRVHRDSVYDMLGRVCPGFELDSPELELLPSELMAELINHYVVVYDVVGVNMNRYSYVLFNVKSEKVRNAYVLPFLREAFQREGYGQQVADICDDVRWCSKTPETIKEVEALEKQYRPLRRGGEAPDFALKNSEGKTVKLSDFKGKHVFVGVFSPEDKEASTRFMALPAQYKNTDRFAYVRVCLGKAGERDAWEKQVKKQNGGDVVSLFCDADHEAFARDYRVLLTPRYIFVNDNGTLRDAWHIAPGAEFFGSVFMDEYLPDIYEIIKR